MEAVYNRCNNCGRECHCGTSHWENVVVNGDEVVEIKVCDRCSCKNKDNDDE
jgi:hypothetical protein